MKKLWQAIANMLIRYGQAGAGMVSYHGPYESKVPEHLKATAQKKD